MKKLSTKNSNIKIAEPVFVRSAKGKGLRFIPMYVHHDTTADELYYKVELMLRDKDAGTWHTVHEDEKWSICQEDIEKLFDFITETTQLKTKETVSVLNSPKEQIAAIEALLEDGKLAEILKNGLLKKEDIINLKTTVRVAEIENAVIELEHLLSSSDTEKDFENWCKENIWVFGNYYVASDEIHQISNAEKVDLLIENAVNCYRDIIEFKKPSLKVLEFDSSHNNYYFSKETSKAIGQVTNYSDIFSLYASDGLHKHKEIKAFYPKSIIVIGRSKDFNEEEIKALRALNGRLNNIEIKTYDDILAQAKNLLTTIKGTKKEDTLLISLDDDVLPF